MSSERDTLESLDRVVRASRAAAVLSTLARDVAALLKKDPTARLAWHSVPLDSYEALPGGIASSWVFVLRAGCSSGAERHPHSIQRVMSYKGRADLQTWDGHSWISHQLNSDPDETLERRWLSIPGNVWHRPIMGDMDWVVVSFHTARDNELIEERPIDDEHPDLGRSTATTYAGRYAR